MISKKNCTTKIELRNEFTCKTCHLSENMYPNILRNQNVNNNKKQNSHEMTAEDFFFTFCLHMCIFFINVFSNVSKIEKNKTVFPTLHEQQMRWITDGSSFRSNELKLRLNSWLSNQHMFCIKL